MLILAIDPGSKESGVVFWDAHKSAVVKAEKMKNNWCLRCIKNFQTAAAVVAIEQIRGYGMVCGDDTFDTCHWSGRFHEAYETNGGKVYLIPRKMIKRHLCGNTTTNDKYIRQALIDRFGEVGTKKAPGPLCGISGHLWAALAVGATCADMLYDIDTVVRETGI
jgi:hypothetical protein